MIKIRRSNERGHANHGWLDTRFTFSFADYFAPKFMGFRVLRVINEDVIEPAQGFPKHGHRDMEIITYVISGELSHRDSMGNGETVRPNEIQRMTAGTGVLHSEYSSLTDKTHLLQIWILPDKDRLTPSYEQKFFPPEEKQGKLKLVASKGGDEFPAQTYRTDGNGGDASELLCPAGKVQVGAFKLELPETTL